MGDLMSNILSVHIFTVSYSAGIAVQVVYKTGYKRTYEDFDKVPASVRDFVSPEHYFSTRYTFSEDGFYSCASHFHSDLSNLVGSFPRLNIACIDALLLTDGPENESEDEPEDEPEDVAPVVKAFPEFDLEIYVSGAYDCTLEQYAMITIDRGVSRHQFDMLDCWIDSNGYMCIDISDLYTSLPFLRFCPLPVLRDSHEYVECGRRHVVEIWKIPLPSHYSYTSIHRVWRGCGSL